MSGVAIILSGQPRNYWYTLPYLAENVVIPNKADVFCLLENGHYDGDQYIKPDANILQNHFSEIIGPSLKLFRFEESIPEIKKEYKQLLENSDTQNTQNVKAIYSQYIKKKYGFRLMKEFALSNNKQYDVITFMRPDIYYAYFIAPQCESNQIYLASRCGDTKCNWMLEAFCIGGFDAMQKASLFVDEYGKLPYTTCPNCKLDDQYKFVVEVQFGEYIHKYKLQIKPMWFDIPSRRNERIPGPHPTSRNIFNLAYPLKYVIDQIDFSPTSK